MIKSGKELKVFSVSQKDLKKFTKEAKKYGVLYTVLRDKSNKNKNAEVDIIARAEDASKIQRIVERFELGTVDKAEIVTQAEKILKNAGLMKLSHLHRVKKPMQFLMLYLQTMKNHRLISLPNMIHPKRKFLSVQMRTSYMMQ